METVERIFIAAPLPAEVRMALSEQLADVDIPGRRVPPSKRHVTVRFLGDVDPVTYERFLAGLDSISGRHSFVIELDGLGAFPRPPKATVLWAGITRGALELFSLNEVAEEAAIGAGLSPEERPYHPHLTLSRIRPPRDTRDLMEAEVSVDWRCKSLVVYRSILQRGGAVYEPIEEFGFA